MKFTSIAAIATALLAAVDTVSAQVYFWPIPKEVVFGKGTFEIDRSFSLSGPSLPELDDTISRYSKLFWKERWTPVVTPLPVSVNDTIVYTTEGEGKYQLKGIKIEIEDTEADLQLGVDESYSLYIPASNGEGLIKAKTQWGAMHAIETLSQLIQDAEGSRLQIPYAPVNITDSPEFSHRGVMLDTARNYYPVKAILRTIDAISYHKLNVFHWHISDSQSFPMLFDKIPELADKGAYVYRGVKQVYNKQDVATIVKYARNRGVRVIPEFDMPGHTRSWGGAFPNITTCTEQFWLNANGNYNERYANEPAPGQVNPLLNETYEVVKSIIDNAAEWFPDNVFHAGGDEPIAYCWLDDPQISNYIAENNVTTTDLFEQFSVKAHGYANDDGKEVMIWEDGVTTLGIQFNTSTILQVWLDAANVKLGASLGYRIVASPYEFWYLDCGHGGWVLDDWSYDQQVAPPVPPELQAVFDKYPNDETNYYATLNYGGQGGDYCSPFKVWQRVYQYDLLFNLTSSEAEKVLGGEVALWSEQADETVVDQRLWMRASAAAEILWSGRFEPNGTQRDVGFAAPRLLDFRYRMVERGLSPEPFVPFWCATNPHGCDAQYPGLGYTPMMTSTH
ncbi:hypothetical protein Unana1_02275 [Umbelopsis nana]